MENENVNSDIPKEIKTENENVNPLLDIISSIQEKLDMANHTNSGNDSNNIPGINNFSKNTNKNFNTSSSFGNSFDTSKLFEMLGNMGINSNKSNSFDSNPFDNLDMSTMMRLGKIFTSLNKEDPRKNLLLSLKPFLRNDRQKNVDTYIFVLGILNVLDSFNNGDSGF